MKKYTEARISPPLPSLARAPSSNRLLFILIEHERRPFFARSSFHPDPWQGGNEVLEREGNGKVERSSRKEDSLARKKEILLGLLKSFQRKWTAPISKRASSRRYNAKSVETGIARLIMRLAFTHDSTMGLSDFTWIDFDFSLGERLDWILVKSSWWNDRNFYYLYFPMCILYYVFFFSNLCEYLCTNFVCHRCESSRIGFYDRIKCIIYQNDKYVNWRNGKWRYVNYGKWNKKGKKKKKEKNVSAAVYSEWHLLIAFRASTSTSRNKKGAILLMMIFAIMIYRARGRFSCGFHGFRKKNLFYTTIEK